MTTTDTTTTALTEEQGEKYLKEWAQVCPYCGSHDINGGDIDFDARCINQSVTCDECNKRWWDVYWLHAVAGEDGDIAFDELGRKTDDELIREHDRAVTLLGLHVRTYGRKPARVYEQGKRATYEKEAKDLAAEMRRRGKIIDL